MRHADAHAGLLRDFVSLLSLAAVAAVGTVSCGPPRKPVGQAGGSPISEAPAPLPGHNLIANESFNAKSTLPWTASFTDPAVGRSTLQNGELCAEISKKGTNRWDIMIVQKPLTLVKGHTYQVQWKMHAPKPTRAYLKLGQAGPPYKEYWKLLFNVEEKPQVFSGKFTMTAETDDGVELAFHLGGALATAPLPSTICVDDVRIDDPQYTPPAEVATVPIPKVIVNQTGYFPRLAKFATVRNPAAVPWELRDSAGKTVANGTTIPFGKDKASGDDVSVIDFTAFGTPGTGFTLKVGADVSHPFDISNDIYNKLKYDALSFFYHQRSGIAIEMPYASDPKWARAAGHIGVAPNRGDTQVPCAPGSGCTYSLDVSGGWYDAGDQGKYVVNAGISTWTLMNWWERESLIGASAADFVDGKMNIPENKNGVADLLDEIRWELEFELKMQVPAGEKLAGMAHHKIHDVKWAADTMAPADDPLARYLQPPSTAATLNLAANGAQAARVWKNIDKAFAEKCLAAAERAWVAALANPEIYAPNKGEGGGPYDDKNLKDDFYWAAAELFITTNKPEYRDVITKSEHFGKVSIEWNDNPGMFTSMTWGDTRALGSISLALVPNGLSVAEVDIIKKNIIAQADLYLGLIPKEGYRVPFGVPKIGYPWGSTSFVLNNALVMGLAHDLTSDDKYLNGAVQGMDYILGRNALDQSYVTGWGERGLQNPYHRFWCHQTNPKYPSPPPGVLSGGANSELQDPFAQAAGLQGCPAQKCFIDHGGAWSVNEVTINWNAPLVWVAAFLDEKALPRVRPAPAKGHTKKK